jgi:hypothetical protein
MENQNIQRASHNINQQLDGADDAEQISIKPLIRTLWSYRVIIAASVSLIFTIFIPIALWLYVNQPSERQASIEFRVLFEAADKGQYPNGLPFSRSEIISTPVLTAVYEANDLKRYGSFDQFKNGVFILESSRDLELLDLDYKAKLADTKLSSVDRERLENEFKQKEEALRVAQYTLNVMSPTGRQRIPDALMNKLLNDILSTWAEQAASMKGVLNYDVRVYTPNVFLKELLEPEDYIVRLDITRDKINKIIGNVDALLELPGANVIRVGEKRISLPEIRANLEDLRGFRVEPLLGLARGEGLSRNVGQLTRYVENRLFQVKLERQEAASRVTTLREALQTYMRERTAMSGSNQRPGPDAEISPLGSSTLIPQLGESFLDRLVTISNQNSDAPYRQKLTDKIIAASNIAAAFEKETEYYEDMMAAVRRMVPARSGSVDRETMSMIATNFDQIYAAVVRALEQEDAVYKDLSTQNLNPRTQMYTITSPFSMTTQRSFVLRAFLEYGVLTVMLSLLLVPFGCLVHYYFRKEILPQHIPVDHNESVGGVHVEAKAKGAGFTD